MKIIHKLERMADLFPDYYEADDIERVEKLTLVYEEIGYLTKKHFLVGIDTEQQEKLAVFCDICIDNGFYSLAKILLEYMLSNNVLDNTHPPVIDFVDRMVVCINKFELTEFLDIDRQADRLRLHFGSDSFSFPISAIPITERVRTLELLYRLTIHDILDSLKIEQSSVDKHSRVKEQTRSLGKDVLQGIKWAQILLVDEIRFSENANKNLLDGQAKNAFEFDEHIFHFYNLLLFPAFGKINLVDHRISIINEGDGALLNPSLTVYSGEEYLLSTPIQGIIQAGESMDFFLNDDHLLNLNHLNRQINRVTLILRFKKFGRQFELERDVETARVIEWLQAHELSTPLIHTEEELFEIVKTFFVNIQHMVEQDEGYKLLVREDDKTVLRPESDIQVALKHWLAPLCKEKGIDLNRETQTGRGPIDFKFSVGQLKCIVEVKLASSSSLAHGVEIQLPTYLIAEKVNYGLYVTIATEKLDEEKSRKIDSAIQSPKEKGLTIEHISIEAWKLDSASKAKTIPDPSRYSASK